MEPSTGTVPKHVGIILDGNRRFAKKLLLKPWKGHEWGSKKVELVLEWARTLGIKELTFYALSLENFNRPKTEFDYLMKLFKSAFQRLLEDKRIEEEEIRIQFIGQLERFDEELQQLMQKLMQKTKHYSHYTINFAVAYGGQQEIIAATKKIAEEVQQGTLAVEEIDKEHFQQALWLASEPELIIRTGGEQRASNFLSFQSAYTEWIYLEKSWPEFEQVDLISAVVEYGQRQRRFGK